MYISDSGKRGKRSKFVNSDDEFHRRIKRATAHVLVSEKLCNYLRDLLKDFDTDSQEYKIASLHLHGFESEHELYSSILEEFEKYRKHVDD